MTLTTSYLILLGGMLVAAGLLKLTLHLVRADDIEARKSAARVGSLKDAILGRARTRDDLLPDARVRGGMIYNRRKKRLEVSGRLSDESFDRVFR